MTERLRFALLGHPVRHSVSPAMCTAAFTALGLPHVYTALDVPTPAGLGRIIDDVRTGMLAGCNVTVPYKRTAFEACDDHAESAVEVGAANVLTRDARGQIIAHNTDAEALAREIDAMGSGRPRNRAVIIGSGGAGLAALVACKKLGFKVICMTSRSWTSTEATFESETAERARALGAITAPWPERDQAVPSAGKLSQMLRMQWSELAAGADCIVQATSAGMLGADPGEEVARVIAWDRLPAHALAYDVVYNPRDTPFLQQAQAHRITASGGLGMLIRQAGLAIELWTGRPPPLDRMREAAEKALAGGIKRR